MWETLSQIYHIAIMGFLIAFGICCMVAGGGGFDHWVSRLKRTRLTRARRWFKPDGRTAKLDGKLPLR